MVHLNRCGTFWFLATLPVLLAKRFCITVSKLPWMWSMVQSSTRTGSEKQRNVFALRKGPEMSVENLESLTGTILARELYATERE